MSGRVMRVRGPYCVCRFCCLAQYVIRIYCDFAKLGRRIFPANSRRKSPKIIGSVSKSRQKSNRAPTPNIRAPTATKSNPLMLFSPIVATMPPSWRGENRFKLYHRLSQFPISSVILSNAQYFKWAPRQIFWVPCEFATSTK